MGAIPKSMEAPNGFVFEQPEGRPFRAISIETEVDGPGDRVAQALNTCGIIGTRHVMSYGSHPGDAHPHVAFLKHDGSVSCGEVVFDRIYLTAPRHAKALRVAMEAMRRLEKKGDVAYNPNCGGHIHIDAQGYGFYDTLRLMVHFGFLEEPVFRLAGAGKTYGHRTLFRGYDRAYRSGYSNPIVKGPFTHPVEAMNRLRGQERMSGLNLVKYMGNYCRGCGLAQPIVEGETFTADHPEVKARMQQWRRDFRLDYGHSPNSDQVTRQLNRIIEYYVQTRGVDMDTKLCQCSKNQHTIEWRVWNSQGNPRIMYAWIALMQALHAYCWRPADDDLYKEYTFLEPFAWGRQKFDKTNRDYARMAQSRVEWMFTELPLTPVEKDALAYTFMRTPYRVWGKGYFADLAQTPYKAPAYENEYHGIPVRRIDDVPELGEENPNMRPVMEDAAPEPAPSEEFMSFAQQILRETRAARAAEQQQPVWTEPITVSPDNTTFTANTMFTATTTSDGFWHATNATPRRIVRHEYPPAAIDPDTGEEEIPF